MKTVYVRWMSIFGDKLYKYDEDLQEWYCAGQKHRLIDSLRYEVNRKDEVAVEPLKKKNGKLHSNIARLGTIGFLIRDKAIFREFRKDCWSYYGGTQTARRGHKIEAPNRLYVGEMNNNSNHAEAWAKMDDSIIGIVIYGHIAELRKEKQDVIHRIAKEFSLPVYAVTRQGELKKIEQ